MSDVSYTAKDIEVLTGLEPVRKRPGMYIGGTDIFALHHMIVEVLDNSIDEVIAGYASHIVVHLLDSGCIAISDNGRGIPVDPHPKYQEKSALEIIMTVLHSGGKFNNKVYTTSGGLHGVGLSVVNALSQKLEVAVFRDGVKYCQTYAAGVAVTSLSSEKISDDGFGHSGTTITFWPDTTIFEECKFDVDIISNILHFKAYLNKKAKFKFMWTDKAGISHDERITYPNGILDYVTKEARPEELVVPKIFTYEGSLNAHNARMELAITWVNSKAQQSKCYCNGIYTPDGGTHEAGLRAGIIKAIRNYIELADKKKANKISVEDVFTSAISILSIFIDNPLFQGQTKNKLLNPECTRLVENVVAHSFEHWLINNQKLADILLNLFIANAETRYAIRNLKETTRKSITKALRLPGKLTDCITTSAEEAEIFIVEGDSAGGTAKQARDKNFQAVLPLKGKILNVLSNTFNKMQTNQEINNLIVALGCGIGAEYNRAKLRYGKVVIMTDADVDGAHISTLLLTFFVKWMPGLIEDGHLYIAQPPLYKISHSGKILYAKDELHKAHLTKSLKGKLEISRFKGLGEMNADQLRSTTMAPESRILLKVGTNNVQESNAYVESIMGKKVDYRLGLIKEYMHVQHIGVK